MFAEVKDAHDPAKTVHVFKGCEQVTPGTMTPLQYDEAVGDLVAYLQWMGEPAQNTRVRIGVWVLLFLGVLHRDRLAAERRVLERRQVSRTAAAPARGPRPRRGRPLGRLRLAAFHDLPRSSPTMMVLYSGTT